jgi:hypothetical protein
MEETNNRQLAEPFRNNERKSRARAYQQQKGDDSREDEEENKNKRVSVAQKMCFVSFPVISAHLTLDEYGIITGENPQGTGEEAY